MSTYHYENLLPERFQQFIQALFIASYPDLRAMPVGQRDGGRDALSNSDAGTVLQVKFKRLDEPASDSASWMIAALHGELEKVKELVKRGATRYVMVTNARGTSQLDAGSIDKVDSWLRDNWPIPAIVHWREDIDRRLDTAAVSLKWQYATILTGTDGIQLAVQEVLSARGRDRATALRSFVATQFDRDGELKFKQVSLSNHLLELFVDVPLRLQTLAQSSSTQTAKGLPEAIRALVRSTPNSAIPAAYRTAGLLNSNRWRVSPWSSVGAARFLLSETGQTQVPDLVLQGAPGQGKSTLAQYVCQVHRAMMLDRGDFLSRILPEHRDTRFRIPFKVDLRDLAKFLRGSDPFSEDDASLPAGSFRSLEQFLVHLVAAYSGGLPFDVSDLVVVLKDTPSLLFFDGLDEVADPLERQKIVDSVVEGVTRLREQGSSIQLVFTSRPTVFGKSPTFRHATFVRISLSDITLQNISNYAEKWMAARDLDVHQQAETRKILRDKLSLSHIADLTRNPMQLTILLTLIHSVGYSLPDERTDLYGRYLELFLNREAEKSPTVLKHRKTLVSVVQHLAWVLQTQAESHNGVGSIRDDDLRDLLTKYLTSNGQSTELVDELFSQGLERIFILVQRIDGHYEFEVQPLREYFCARYLYETAPVGTYRRSELSGDRAQRLEALARSPFWLNVCRFYGGSYEKGDISGITSSLRELMREGTTGTAIQARVVGAALLSDWVFRERPFAQSEIVEAVFDRLGLHLAAAGLLNPQYQGVIALPVDCGREALGTLLAEIYRHELDDPATEKLDRLFEANGGETVGGQLAEMVFEREGVARTRRLQRLSAIGGLTELSDLQLVDAVTSDSPDESDLAARLSYLLANEPARVNDLKPLAEAVVRLCLSGHLQTFSAFSGLVPTFARLVYGEAGLISLATLPPDHDAAQAPSNADSRVEAALARLRSTPRFSEQGFDPWRDPAVWVVATSVLQESFGTSWAEYRLALECAATIDGSKRGGGAKDLYDRTVPSALRARYARFVRDDAYWSKQATGADNTLDRMLWCALLVQWSSAKAFDDNCALLNEWVGGLSESQFSILVDSMDRFSDSEALLRRRQQVPRPLRDLSPRAARLVLGGFTYESETPSLSTQQKELASNADWLRRHTNFKVIAAANEWEGVPRRRRMDTLQALNSLFATGEIYRAENLAKVSRIPMPADLCEIVLSDANAWTSEVVQLAASSVMARYDAPKVEEVSIAEAWALV